MKKLSLREKLLSMKKRKPTKKQLQEKKERHARLVEAMNRMQQDELELTGGDDDYYSVSLELFGASSRAALAVRRLIPSRQLSRVIRRRRWCAGE